MPEACSPQVLAGVSSQLDASLQGAHAESMLAQVLERISSQLNAGIVESLQGAHAGGMLAMSLAGMSSQVDPCVWRACRALMPGACSH